MFLSTPLLFLPKQQETIIPLFGEKMHFQWTDFQQKTDKGDHTHHHLLFAPPSSSTYRRSSSHFCPISLLLTVATVWKGKGKRITANIRQQKEMLSTTVKKESQSHKEDHHHPHHVISFHRHPFGRRRVHNIVHNIAQTDVPSFGCRALVYECVFVCVLSWLTLTHKWNKWKNVECESLFLSKNKTLLLPLPFALHLFTCWMLSSSRSVDGIVQNV